MTIAHTQVGPDIELECSLPSEVAATSRFVDRLMLLLRKCGCVPPGESDVEIALREALGNAIIHGNHEHSRKRVCVRRRCETDGVSITVKGEGKGFDISRMSDPTAPQNIASRSWPWHLPNEDVDGRSALRKRWSCRSPAKERPGRDRRRAEVLAGAG